MTNNYHPNLEDMNGLKDQGNLVPVFREIDAGDDTPVSAYLKVTKGPYSFLLESVEGTDQAARFSLIGTEPEEIFITGPAHKDGLVDPLINIEKYMDQFKIIPFSDGQRFNGGAVGYISYDAAGYFEKLPSNNTDPLALPESIFMMTFTFLIFDHVRKKIRVVSHARLDRNIEYEYAEATDRIDQIIERLQSNDFRENRINKPLSIGRQITANMTKDQFEKIVNETKKYIQSGDIIQAVISRRLARQTSADPFDIYTALRAINPSPYMYYLDLNGFQIVGASPELLVQVDNGMISTHPIAGTLPRGETPEEDILQEEKLLNDQKERAEHVMLLDLGRNDIGRVSKPGTVSVTQMMDIEKYSHVMHIVSHVTGKLDEPYNSFDALRACFPAGTLSGAPKIRAMEIISDLEPHKRGPYGGAVGYFDLSGNMDTAITIRTMIMKDGVAYTQSGGGIVFDSKPENEYQETLHKSSAILRAIDMAEKMQGG